MNKFIKLAMTFQLIAMILLASCATGVSASANVCHATGDAAPYEEITLNSTELLNEHRMHAEDIFPIPVGGCPTSLVEVTDGNITICHTTSSESNPYEEITISVNGLSGHGDHEGDIIPMPLEGCPTTPLVNDDDDDKAITVCHATDDTLTPYEELTVTEAELSEHLEHSNDINPVPATGCPEYPIVITDGAVTFCHATGDVANPYEEITVSVNGLDGHDEHADDVFPVSEEGCPSDMDIVTDKITICHATSSKKNSYNQITVSANGLNGHNKHADDIIPMPAGGCPQFYLQFKRQSSYKDDFSF